MLLWEGPFKSRALLDEATFLSGMAYVDLNPVGPGVAEDVSGSDFTSRQQRLIDYALERQNDRLHLLLSSPIFSATKISGYR